MKHCLHRIEIRNFKAFRKFELELDGKHLLVYGPNGSGKSSLYWALHCFLQSAGKETSDVVKYFDADDPEKLLNIHEDPVENPGEIAVTLREMALKTDTTYRLNQSIHGTKNVRIIRTADLASDFITYRFSFGFAHFRNSEGFNIWPLFEREILPFCVSTGSGNPYECWRAINGITANYWNHKGIAGKNAYEEYRTHVANFATLLPEIVERISSRAREFYDQFFDASDSQQITFELQLTRNALYPKTNRADNFLLPPVIELVIKSKGANVQRPHIFLNEAKITQLALSVRLAASLVNLQQQDGPKLLVLDDLLVSLDMSNRMRVVEILMSPTFDSYQKIMLTHDLGLFQEMKRRIGPSHPGWLFYKMDTDVATGSKLSVSKTDLELAQHYLENDQLEECGNRLRKHAEANLEAFLVAARDNRGLASTYDHDAFSSLASKIGEAKGILETAEASKFAKLLQRTFTKEDLKRLLDPAGIDHTTLSKSNKREKGKAVAILLAEQANLLDVILGSLTDASRKRQNALDILADVGHIKDRILNPASHSGVAPIYTKEAEDAIKVIQQLEGALQAALRTL